MVISSDGFAEIYKYVDEEYESIVYDYTTGIINLEGYNHLNASCIGDELILNVNGQEVLRGNSTDLKPGNIGLIAGAYEIPGIEANFDNLIVVKP